MESPEFAAARSVATGQPRETPAVQAPFSERDDLHVAGKPGFLFFWKGVFFKRKVWIIIGL